MIRWRSGSWNEKVDRVNVTFVSPGKTLHRMGQGKDEKNVTDSISFSFGTAVDKNDDDGGKDRGSPFGTDNREVYFVEFNNSGDAMKCTNITCFIGADSPPSEGGGGGGTNVGLIIGIIAIVIVVLVALCVVVSCVRKRSSGGGNGGGQHGMIFAEGMDNPTTTSAAAAAAAAAGGQQTGGRRQRRRRQQMPQAQDDDFPFAL